MRNSGAEITLAFLMLNITASAEALQDKPFLTTKSEITLLTANDAGIAQTRTRSQDSVTVIRLRPDQPPQSVTIYGTVPHTLLTLPRLAISSDGRYGFVTNNTFRFGSGAVDEPDIERTNLLSVIDLASTSLEVRHVDLPPHPFIVVPHPDGRKVIVNSDKSFHVIEVRDGVPSIVSESDSPVHLLGFDISPHADLIVATALPSSYDPSSYLEKCCEIHTFAVDGDDIRHQSRVRVPDDFAASKPFFSRISPDGKVALVLDGGGLGDKGTLDGVLAIDLTLEEPAITAMVPQVGDGLETLAFHPSGRLAVVGCLGTDDAHLAVIDLTGENPRLLYQLPFESLPEGIEFTPDGSKMFVVATRQNHIVVFDVDGFVMKRSPFVLRTGHGPASLAVSPTFGSELR